MNRFHNRVRSQKDEIKVLIDSACSYVQECKQNNLNLTTDEFYFRLVLDETLENARRHGNNNDDSKHIELDIFEENNHICLIVKDEGNGFNPQNVKNPRDIENRFKQGGRGIHILKNLANVSWNTAGNEIHIVL
jgi:anti-sigma regulatory factor (Ser/Thr protein kinase)